MNASASVTRIGGGSIPFALLVTASVLAALPALGSLLLMWLELTDELPPPLWQVIPLFLVFSAPAVWIAIGWVSSALRLPAIARVAAWLSVSAFCCAVGVYFVVLRLLA